MGKGIPEMAALLALSVSMAPSASYGEEPCDFQVSFQRPDEQGSRRVKVYEGNPDASLRGARPLAFVSDLKVNTDGTRISYKVDDPRAKDGAINNILNAMRKGHLISEFEELAKNHWQPLNKTWHVLNRSVIERDERTGEPCVDANNYLVSMTADVAVAGGHAREGDCDQTKWLDALSIPAIVLPEDSQFQSMGAGTRNFAIVMTLGAPERIAYGVVGDAGPDDEIGEASVQMNRILNGLPDGEHPKNYRDAVARFQGAKSVILVFPGNANRLSYPVTAERVKTEVKARFDQWGGKARLDACLGDIPESGR